MLLRINSSILQSNEALAEREIVITVINYISKLLINVSNKVSLSKIGLKSSLKHFSPQLIIKGYNQAMITSFNGRL